MKIKKCEISLNLAKLKNIENTYKFVVNILWAYIIVGNCLLKKDLVSLSGSQLIGFYIWYIQFRIYLHAIPLFFRKSPVLLRLKLYFLLLISMHLL